MPYVSGYFTRTYNFFVTHTLCWNSVEGFMGYGLDNDWLPAGFSTIRYESLVANASGAANLLSGVCNMYSVTDLPVALSRAFGFSKYTVINLDWIGMERLHFAGYFYNQSNLLKRDCSEYAYWRPLSVSVKFVPQYSRPPSESVNSQCTKAHIPPVQTFLQTAGGTVNELGGPLSSSTWSTVPTSKVFSAAVTSGATAGTDITYSDSKLITRVWNSDARNLVGYIIPAEGDTADNLDQPNGIRQQYSGIFGTVGHMPNAEFLSSFRRSNYARAYLSFNKPTRFTYNYPRPDLAATFSRGGSTASGGAWYPNNPKQFYFSQAANNPFSNIIDVTRRGWLSATAETIGQFRTEATIGDYTANTNIVYSVHKYIPYQNAVLFIPGVDVETLTQRYNLQFSYRCQYGSKIYDYQ